MQQIQQVEVQHLRRDGNRAAHGLARYAQNVNDFVTWMEETPTIINSEVVSDAVPLSKTPCPTPKPTSLRPQFRQVRGTL